MSDQVQFGAWLRQRRKEYGYTQEELADLAGCSPATIRKIEAGERRPSRQIADLLFEHLEVPPQERESVLRLVRLETHAGGGHHAPFQPISAISLVVPKAPDATAGTTPNAAVPELETQRSTLRTQHPNLPVLLTPFIGREATMQAVRERLLREDVRLLTLTGPPGIGKTRLSVEVAAGLLDLFRGGVFFVGMAPVASANLVVHTVAQTLGVKDAPGEPLQDSIAQFLRDKRSLLLLDNFEHVMEAAPLVVDLLSACPGLKILVTSREALHLRGERQFPVPPLDLPIDGQSLDRDTLAANPAIALFVERAQAAKPTFELTEENAEAVAAICSRLDGLPLAIELAAARVKLLSPGEIVSRLGKSLPLLTGGPRDLPARQQTLRAAIEWIYNLLDPADQTLFARLGVFAGGCTLEAAEAVCNPTDDRRHQAVVGRLSSVVSIVDGIESLLDKSLLRQGATSSGEPRFTMLETIREFALERLEESGEAEIVRRYHAEHYLGLAKKVEVELRGGRHAEGLDLLEGEYDNIRAAVAWAIERRDVDLALQYVGVLWRFWYMRSYLTEGRRWLGAALALPISDFGLRAAESRDTPQSEIRNPKLAEARALALNGAGNLAYTQGDYDQAKASHEQSLAISRQLGDKRAVAGSLNNLGLIARLRGNYEEALNLYREALQTNREVDNPNWGAINLNNMGAVAYDLGDYVQSRSLQEQSLAIFTELDNQWGIAMVLSDLGRLANNEGDYASAMAHYERGLAIQRGMGDKRGMAVTLSNIALAAWNRGELPGARNLYQESLALFGDLGDKRGTASALNGLGHVASSRGDFGSARDFYERSLELREQLGYKYEIAGSRHNLGYVALREGRLDEAEPLLQRSIEEFRELGDRWAIAFSLNNLARVWLARGEFDRARALLDESLALCREIGSKRGLTYSLSGLGLLAVREGDLEAAERYFREELALAAKLEAKWDVARGLMGMAWVARMTGNRERGVRLLGASERLREEMEATWEPSLRGDYENAVVGARTALGDKAFEAAWQAGHDMNMEQAVDYALTNYEL